MSNERTDASDLWPAICDFTKPASHEIKRDDPADEDLPAAATRNHTQLPSLWHQLLAADARTGGSGGSKPGSRPPISVEVVVLVDTIRAAVAKELVESNRRYIRHQQTIWPNACAIPLKDPTGDVPTDLRRLNNRYRTDPNRAAQMARTIRKWITNTTEALGLERPKASYIRVPCMNCRATMIPEQLPGESEPRMRPVLRLIWQGETARATECRACGDTRWPGDFHLLAEFAEDASLTKETLAGYSSGKGW